jgi:hypothetical protein
MLEEQPFDFRHIRVLVKRQDEKVAKVVMLEKKWTHTNIPHFRPVIEGVSDKEGIEISLSCNLNAFEWIISHLRKMDPNFIEKGQRECER